MAILFRPDVLQIDKYYDLMYNSLVIWSTRKWGCSGKHITGKPVCDNGNPLPSAFQMKSTFS